jgi:hypothetical protein
MLRSKLRVVFGRDASGWYLLICVLVLLVVGFLFPRAGNVTETRQISYSDIAHAYHGLLLDRELKEIKLDPAVIERIQDSMIESLTAVPEVDANSTTADGLGRTRGNIGPGVPQPRIGIKLFNVNPTFSTGPQTSPAEAIPFASTSVLLSFKAGDSAFLSSTPDGTGPIVIDNFLTINGVNTCEGVANQEFPDSCFGPFINPDLPAGVPIQNVLTPIPPIDVSPFIPIGTTSVLFELRDFGVLAGNSELFLVTTGQYISMPPLDKTDVTDVLAGFNFSTDERILTKSALIQTGIDLAPADEKLEYQWRFDLIHQSSLNFISSTFGTFRPGFKSYLNLVGLEETIKLILERLTSRYIADCRANEVPIPPDWPTGDWKNRGFLPAEFIFASQDKAAEVWTYEAVGRGLCYALPRTKVNEITKKNEILLLGIICQSKSTGKACFWDNRDARTGVQIVRTLPLQGPYRIARLQGGDTLIENCTACHRGDNAFIIINPDETPLGEPSDRNPDVRYDPISGQANWSNPPAFSPKGSGGACAGCHEIPALNPEICGFLREAADRTMPNTAAPAGWISPSEAYAAHISAMKTAMCPQ